jgi:hypothetical protein
MTHQLIASPYPEGHVIVRPGYDGASGSGPTATPNCATHRPMPRSPPGSPVRSEPGGARTWPDA